MAKKYSIPADPATYYDPESEAGARGLYSDELLDTVSAIWRFIGDNIIRRQDGKHRSLNTIARRLIVFEMLIQPGRSESLSSEAKRLGVTRACLSKIAKEFTQQTGLPIARTKVGTKGDEVSFGHVQL